MRLVSEATEAMHRDHLRTLKLKHSVFEKSYPALVGKDISDYTLTSRLPKGEREELFALKGNILAHELYFSCFIGSPSVIIIPDYRGSYSELKYRLLCSALCSDGFLVLFSDGGELRFYAGNAFHRLFERHKPIFALDLCEHAYFYDYGFRKEEYLKAAISMIDFRQK